LIVATLLFTSTFGSDDPTRATFAFVLAAGAVEAGHDAQIVLLGEAVYLMKNTIAQHIQAVGLPALAEIFQKTIDYGIPVFV
jgi:predicted peroxiredoxin